MAEVFLAQQRGLEGFDRRVAVKRILPHLADSPDFVKMFLGEAKLAAQLTHPNIVHIYEFGKVDSDYFIAMEYVDGVHAGQLFKHGEKLPAALIARIGADASAALHYAHELRGPTGKPYGLVHRDVSPANIMVSFDGVVKLCDFGIAKAAMLTDQLTNPGQVKGKYAYMSPEQTIAQQLDGRSDVFSLAIVMWELLAGRFIVSRNDAVEAMRAIRDGRLDSIDKVVPDVPPPLAKALSWALEAKRDRRATAADLTQNLEAYIKAAPELATSMQLGAWVRARFPRESTGQHAAITGIAQRTQAASGTVAPSTAIASGTQGPLTPPMLASKAVRQLYDDTQPLETSDLDAEAAETLKAGHRADPTLLDPGRPSEAELLEETALHTSTRARAIGTASAAALPKAAGLPTSSAAALPRPRTMPPFEIPSGRRASATRRIPRTALAVAGLFGLAIASFLIALAASGHGKSAPPDAAIARDASQVTITPLAADAEPIAPPPVDAPPSTPEMLVEIDTSPTGALVHVGGQSLYAPAKVALPAGHYDVVAELAGYRTEHRPLDLINGDHPILEIAFTHKLPVPHGVPIGRLTARTTPYSDVYEGNKKVGQTPFADLELPVGTHTLSFKNPSHPTITKTVRISAGHETKVQFDLP